MRHSVILEYKKCRGCTTCIKNCPTEAIRVRNGKATILPNRCIDCGTCIRVCPHSAVRSVPDSFDVLQNFQYNVAVPDPSLYGQFHNLDTPARVLRGLLDLGFDYVYEAAAAAEQLAGYVRSRPADTSRPCPEISSTCPAVVRLICIRFPDLLGHLAPIVSPLELAAVLARRKAAEQTGLSPDEIGVFSIVPCSSLVTSAAVPDGLRAPVLDGAFAVSDVYRALLDPMRRVDERELARTACAGAAGVGWACIGGEAKSCREGGCIVVDGISNVIKTLEEIEAGHVPEADFIELRACTQGCLGGCLTVEDPYIARMRMRRLMADLPRDGVPYEPGSPVEDVLDNTQKPEFLPTYVLDPDRKRAMEKMRRIQHLEEHLPGLRCGSCGAPSCRAFAEDVIMGRAVEDDCIFKVRERMQSVAGGTDADYYLPAPFRRKKSVSSREGRSTADSTEKARTSMTVKELALLLKLKEINLADPDRKVSDGYCGDLLSWVMGNAGEDCAWMTIMSNVNVAAVASLTDVACVIFTEGVEPDPVLVKRATQQGINLLGTSRSSYDCAAALAEVLK